MEATIEFHEIIENVSISFEEITESVSIEVVETTEVFTIEFAELGVPGIQGEKGDPGGNYVDIELTVTEDGQIEFNIFSEPTKSNLYINDSIYFKDRSYQIQNVSGNWRLIWLNEFELSTTDLLIFRKT